MTYAEGTFPIVFESGVLRFDDDGALHMHLSHSAEAPHPFATHPDGSDGHVGADLSEVVIRGAVTARRAVEGTSFQRANALPDGFVVTIHDWELAKVEASGDLSILVKGVQDVPDWFESGKIQRFAGPDEAVKLFFETAPPPPQREPEAPKWTPPPKAEAQAQSKSGCALMALTIGVVLLLLL